MIFEKLWRLMLMKPSVLDLWTLRLLDILKLQSPFVGSFKFFFMYRFIWIFFMSRFSYACDPQFSHKQVVTSYMTGSLTWLLWLVWFWNRSEVKIMNSISFNFGISFVWSLKNFNLCNFQVFNFYFLGLWTYICHFIWDH